MMYITEGRTNTGSVSYSLSEVTPDSICFFLLPLESSLLVLPISLVWFCASGEESYIAPSVERDFDFLIANVCLTAALCGAKWRTCARTEAEQGTRGREIAVRLV